MFDIWPTNEYEGPSMKGSPLASCEKYNNAVYLVELLTSAWGDLEEHYIIIQRMENEPIFPSYLIMDANLNFCFEEGCEENTYFHSLEEAENAVSDNYRELANFANDPFEHFIICGITPLETVSIEDSKYENDGIIFIDIS